MYGLVGYKPHANLASPTPHHAAPTLQPRPKHHIELIWKVPMASEFRAIARHVQQCALNRTARNNGKDAMLPTLEATLIDHDQTIAPKIKKTLKQNLLVASDGP